MTDFVLERGGEYVETLTPRGWRRRDMRLTKDLQKAYQFRNL